MGYKFSQAHHEATAVKTDAPPEVVWDIMRVFARDIAPPVGSQNRKPSAVAEKILAKEPIVEVSFVEPKGMQRWKDVRERGARFPQNPEAGWGPKAAKGRAGTEGRIKASLEGAEGCTGDDAAAADAKDSQVDGGDAKRSRKE